MIRPYAICYTPGFFDLAALGSAVLSRGVEEHAGFSTQSARATTEIVDAYRIVLACELVAAVRAQDLLARLAAFAEAP